MVTATKKSKKGEKSIFRTNFKVHAIDRTEDPNDPSKRIISKKFEAVSRLEGKSDEGCSIVLDYQSELISLAEGDKVDLAISESDSLMDEFSYVMFGRIFKYEKKEGDQLAMYASFGGMMLELLFPIGTLDTTRFPIDAQPYLYLTKA